MAVILYIWLSLRSLALKMYKALKHCTVLPGSVFLVWERSGSGGAEESFVFPRISPGDPQQKPTSRNHELTQLSAERH